MRNWRKDLKTGCQGGTRLNHVFSPVSHIDYMNPRACVEHLSLVAQWVDTSDLVD